MSNDAQPAAAKVISDASPAVSKKKTSVKTKRASGFKARKAAGRPPSYRETNQMARS